LENFWKNQSRVGGETYHVQRITKSKLWEEIWGRSCLGKALRKKKLVAPSKSQLWIEEGPKRRARPGKKHTEELHGKSEREREGIH